MKISQDEIITRSLKIIMRFGKKNLVALMWFRTIDIFIYNLLICHISRLYYNTPMREYLA